MAGLLAARVLSDHFAQVTLVERDRLSNGGLNRRGVPQARHAHVLLPRGSTILEELFPGILQQMVEAGVPVADSLDQFHVNLGGHLFFRERGARGSRRDEGVGLLYEPSRPFLERLVLDRLRELPNLDLLDGCDVGSPLTDRSDTRVTGVSVAPHEVGSASLELRADLVVCATGRNGRAGTWLRSMGYAPPPEEQVSVDVK
jgi:2-polyprenyl-6-methoxyphenol hydroxylase-like FAD-dependent oxidoreductase